MVCACNAYILEGEEEEESTEEIYRGDKARTREREREKYRTSDGGFKGNEGRKEREDR